MKVTHAFAIAGIVIASVTGCSTATTTNDTVTITSHGVTMTMGAHTMRACVDEDTSDESCVWDASSRGNGDGGSFVTINNDDSVVFVNVSHDDARRLLVNDDVRPIIDPTMIDA